MRTLAKDLPAKVGSQATIQGWLHKKRLLGGLTFILVRDRSGITQALVKDKGEVEKLRGLQPGTVLAVSGVVASDDRAPGGVEIHETSLHVDVPVEFESPIEIDKPLSHESENLDTLFDYRVIGLRNPREAAVFKIQAEVKEAIRQYYKRNGFVEFNSPKLLPGATEGGAEVFRLDYFGKEATLAQSAQFYKQILVGVYERVFEINPTYRAEPSATTRHMTEFMHVDVEMGFVDLKDLMEVAGNMLRDVVGQTWQHCQPELQMWGATPPVLGDSVPALTLADIHQKYTQATGTSTIGEKDLRPDEERWVCEYAKEHLGSEAVFVTEWPASEMKFYHQANAKNQAVVDRFDMLFRGVEIMTGSMREHRYGTLLQQLKDLANGDPEADGYRYYLQAFRYGMPPHGGLGMGLERLSQKIIGLNNVKEATLFPRDINRLAP